MHKKVRLWTVVILVAVGLSAACGDKSSPTSPSSTRVTAPPAPPPPPAPRGTVEVLNVRRFESSTSFWRVAGTVRNKTGRTINRLSEVRIDVFNASDVLINEDRDLFGESVSDEQQATFEIPIRKRDVVEASYYTLEVTNFINGDDVVQQCSGCGRRQW